MAAGDDDDEPSGTAHERVFFHVLMILVRYSNAKSLINVVSTMLCAANLLHHNDSDQLGKD